ncbi:MAG TPA: toll/interleukin-1 receptor domain-containing protein [Bryobacteraceae bacterium]|nr:toll/interleukin-1 receptor domain-containing protein [Bryobacteraceae bacterium]
MEGSTVIGDTADSPTQAKVRRRIFISYGHDENAVLAERIKNDLEERGHEVWFDKESLKPGVNWDAHIEKGLNWVAEDPARGRVVLVITPHAVGRPDGYCLNEVALALDLKLRVFPVVVVWCRPPLSIYRIQRLDMRDCVPLQQNLEHYGKKFQLLADALESEGELPKFDDIEPELVRHLQPLDYSADIRLHSSRFIGRAWVFDAIDKWLRKPNASRVFCITGWAGTGKSAVAAYLCAKRPEIVAFHICVHGHTHKADPRRCITSIAYQLTTQFPLYRERLGAADWDSLKDANTLTLFDELIVRQLGTDFSKPGQTCLIVIDALDEATQGDLNELVTFIAAHFKRAPEWLRLIITARPVPQVVGALPEFDSFVLDTERPENLKDIREYAQRELAELIADDDARARAATAIVSRSEGLFLYAYWVCEELKQGRLPIDEPENFPLGLRGAYRQFFERQFAGGDTYGAIRPKLAVIAAGYDALPKEVLNETFQLDEISAKRIFDPLRPLFPCVDGRYRPFHRSILDWLGDTGDNGAGVFCVDVAQGHRQLAAYCWNKCAERIKRSGRLRDQYQTYAFQHGVRHLIEARRFAEAVDLLYYLFGHSDEFSPDERADLNQMAKLLTIALGEGGDEVPNPEKISAAKLSEILQGLYMSQPLKGGIRLLVKYHTEQWPTILEKFLSTDDYVLRHTIAEVLANDYLETGERLESIYGLLDNPDLNHQELGVYALQEVYAGEPDVIQSKYLNRLGDGEIYSFRSALGDLLLGLALQDVGGDNFRRLDVMNQVNRSTIFWNPIWDFNRMDIAWLKAIDYFARKQTLPPDAPKDVTQACRSLAQTEKLRQELLLQTKGLPDEIRHVLKSYYRLGIRPETIPENPSVVRGIPGLERVFEVLFAHPLWLITETAASLLASLVDEDPLTSHYIINLFEHDLWRVQYGAAEAAFLARFRNKNELFRQAINSFYRHPEPLLHGNCAENLAAWILDSIPSKRRELMLEFEQPFTHWLCNEDEDAWVLDHLYRLFHRLSIEGMEADCAGLANDNVSSLLAGEPKWYTVDRQTFLRRIERQKRAQTNKSRSATLS